MPWNTRAPSWTDPSGSAGVDPGAAQAKFQYLRQYGNRNLGGIQGALAGQNQLGVATQQAIGSIAQIMQQRKQDQIANVLLQQKANDPLMQQVKATGATGSQALSLYQALQSQGQQGEDSRLTQAIKQAQLNKLNAPDTTVDTPYGKMEPYQWAQIANKGGDSSGDDWKRAVPVARGWLAPDGTFTNDPAAAGKPSTADASQGDMVKLQLPNATKNSAVVVPWASYAAKTGIGQQVQSSTNVPQGTNQQQPEVDPVARAKQALADPNASPAAKTAAQQILDNAGG